MNKKEWIKAVTKRSGHSEDLVAQILETGLEEIYQAMKREEKVTLTIVYLPDKTIRLVTPLTHLQTQILTLLNLPPTLYTRLAEN